MDNIPEVTPHKKKFPLTYAWSVKVLSDRCKKHRYYKDRKLTEFTDRIENISVVDVIKHIGFCHRECCKTFGNLNEVKSRKTFQWFK